MRKLLTLLYTLAGCVALATGGLGLVAVVLFGIMVLSLSSVFLAGILRSLFIRG